MRILECIPPAEAWLPLLEASIDVVQLCKLGSYGCEKLGGEKELRRAPLEASLPYLGAVLKLHLSPSAEVHGVPKSDLFWPGICLVTSVAAPRLLADPGTTRGQLCSPCSSTGLGGTPAPACPAGGFPSLTKQPAPAAVLAAVIPVLSTGFDLNLQEHPSAWYQDPWIKVTLSRPKDKEHCFIKKKKSQNKKKTNKNPTTPHKLLNWSLNWYCFSRGFTLFSFWKDQAVDWHLNEFKMSQNV